MKQIIVNANDFLVKEMQDYTVRDFARRVEQSIKLSRDEEFALAAIARQGKDIRAEKARETLMEAEYRVVFNMAKKFCCNGVEMADLIQEGMFGLITAVDRFDTSFGKRLGSYASFWVRQAMQRYVMNSSFIRFPVHVHELLEKIMIWEEKYFINSGMEPSLQEIALAMNESLEYIKKFYKFTNMEFVTLDEAQKELDEKISKNEYDTGADFEEVENNELRDFLENIFKTVSGKEQFVLKLRYGLIDGDTHTLEDIGMRLSLSRERIRQIQARAIRKVRHPSRSRDLRDFLVA